MPIDAIPIDAEPADGPLRWFHLRSPAPNEGGPSHQTVQAIIIGAADREQATTLLFRMLGAGYSVVVDEAEYASQEEAIDAARGEIPAEEFSDRVDVVIGDPTSVNTDFPREEGEKK